MIWCDRCGWRDLQCQGCEVAEQQAIAMEARQGGDGETRLHPKDDSADPKGIAPKDIAHD